MATQKHDAADHGDNLSESARTPEEMRARKAELVFHLHSIRAQRAVLAEQERTIREEMILLDEELRPMKMAEHAGGMDEELARKTAVTKALYEGVLGNPIREPARVVIERVIGDHRVVQITYPEKLGKSARMIRETLDVPFDDMEAMKQLLADYTQTTVSGNAGEPLRIVPHAASWQMNAEPVLNYLPVNAGYDEDLNYLFFGSSLGTYDQETVDTTLPVNLFLNKTTGAFVLPPSLSMHSRERIFISTEGRKQA